jgi:hypothetical protein
MALVLHAHQIKKRRDRSPAAFGFRLVVVVGRDDRRNLIVAERLHLGRRQSIQLLGAECCDVFRRKTLQSCGRQRLDIVRREGGDIFGS